MDLKLVPIDDLLHEIEERTSSFVAAYCVPDPQDKTMDWFFYGKGSRSKAVQLSTDLQRDVLHNWNGELKTLQRINSDDIV